MDQDREQKINLFIVPSALYITLCIWQAAKLSPFCVLKYNARYLKG